ncbi:hypothetical protein DPEC_G00334030 [Dallia pectoralis]|uniref:Uncharacterized protein n=1 Tax=Dallia pectoralis TaxID=75939 RepID=A0ACC2F6M5_DALPE|nr:hypothetical protein DPEC_G00334030 [Dallia pectoralis]
MDSSLGGCGMARLGICVVLMGLWRLGAACPAFCTCSISRIACVDPGQGIEDFPILTLDDMEMDINITDIYIANQNKLFDINDNSLKYYSNLRNLTVINTSLTSISSQAFNNNTRLQYLNLRNNNLSTLSWRTFQNLNITSFPLLSGNPLKCVCENLWIKLRLQEDVESPEKEDLKCIDDRGKRKSVSRISPPDCEPPAAEVSPSIVTVKEGSDVTAVCSATGSPSPEIVWNTENLFTTAVPNPYGTESRLTLTDLSPSDNGRVITCNVQNVVGQSEAELQLNILFRPSILELLEPMSLHHWCIPFTVTGNPKPELQWYHKDQKLHEQEYIKTEIQESIGSVHHGCLQLINPTHIHNGQYTLVARNEYGEDSKVIEAHFLLPPDEETDMPYYPCKYFRMILSFR